MRNQGKDVRWTNGFWRDAVASCAKSMVPQLEHMFEAKEISHVVENFRICAGEAEGDFDGTFFGGWRFLQVDEIRAVSASRFEGSGKISKAQGVYLLD